MRHALATVPTTPGSDMLGGKRSHYTNVYGATLGLRDTAPNGYCRVYDKDHNFIGIDSEEPIKRRFIARDLRHLPQEST